MRIALIDNGTRDFHGRYGTCPGLSYRHEHNTANWRPNSERGESRGSRRRA